MYTNEKFDLFESFFQLKGKAEKPLSASSEKKATSSLEIKAEVKDSCSLEATDHTLEIEKPKHTITLKVPVVVKGNLARFLKIKKTNSDLLPKALPSKKIIKPKRIIHKKPNKATKGLGVFKSIAIGVVLIGLSFVLIAFLFNTLNPILVICFAMLIYSFTMMQMMKGDFSINYETEETGYVNGEWVKYRDVTIEW